MNDRWRDKIVWRQNACLEWTSGVMDREQAVFFFPFLLSAAPCPVMAAWLALHKKYQPLLFSWLLPWLIFYQLLIIFYKAGGVILGCVKTSEHICWSKNVQTRCVSRIINLHLLISGKQSFPLPGFICLAPMTPPEELSLMIYRYFLNPYSSKYSKM